MMKTCLSFFLLIISLVGLQAQKPRLVTPIGHTGRVTSVAFSPAGKTILTGSWDNTAKLWDLSGRELQTFTGHASPVRSVAFSPDGKTALTGSSDSTAKLWDLSGRALRTFAGHASTVISVAFSPDGKTVLTGSGDNTAKLWDLAGHELQTFAGHANYVKSVAFSPDGKTVLTDYNGHMAKLRDAQTGQELATLVAIDSTDWLVTSPSGLFDASPGTMRMMYYMVGLEIIDLKQLKERYYEPGLLAKVLGLVPGGLRPVGELSNLELYPKITSASIEGDRLKVQLEPRNGGMGKVVLLLNGNMQLEANANPELKTAFELDLNRYADYFIADSINHLSLHTYNKAGWLQSPEYPLDYRPSGVRDRGNPLTSLHAKKAAELESINLYALVVGTSVYSNGMLTLKYPDKDAAAFAEALRLTGGKLFGDNIEVTLLTTSAEPWPRKAEIAKALSDIAAKADPNDILLVYLSGHGISYPPNSEKGQFYYLTTDISSDNLEDPVARNTKAIAQDSLQYWINQVKARKRILILDACNSGKVVETLAPGEKALNSDQRRALERMTDRSGMFVLAGSAADKSSFEASSFGHGLLTYSLLNNMPLVAASNKSYIDVGKLFGNTLEEVPRLAKDIGRVQKPELIGAGSFDIGIIDGATPYTIPQTIPVFLRANFMDSQKNKDLQHLSTEVNNYLNSRASVKQPALAFWDISEFAGDHYYIGGQYRTTGETIEGNATLYRKDEKLADIPFSGLGDDLNALAKQIIDRAFGYLNKSR